MRIKRTHQILIGLVIVISLLFGIKQSFLAAPGGSASPLVINEFLAVNGSSITDEDGDYSDWIEIHNRSNLPVNLAGWSLTDDLDQMDKWIFPDVTLEGHEYLVVYASGKDRRTNKLGSVLHTNFRLSEESEFLGLYSPTSRRFLDAIELQYPEQARNVSFGRYGEGLSYAYLVTPTPGGPNAEASVRESIVSPVDFSVERGFYDVPFTLELSTTTPGATIRYTTDGSEPTETYGTVYTGPISIDTTTAVRAIAFGTSFVPSYVDTHTYLFLDSILTQPADVPGFPSTWGTHQSGEPVIADYEMDPEVVNDPHSGELIRSALKSIPTLSLVTDVQNLDIYANPGERGVAWERPVSAELIYPDGEQPGFQINAGLRIQGGVGRSTIIPKHSFRLFFKGRYGPTKLEYPLFRNSPVTSFDTVTLRAGMNRSYAGKLREPRVHLNLTTYTRDEWLRSSQIAMSGTGSHGMFVHLYLNGLYWGLYNVVERPDASFLSSYFGGEEEDWYVHNHSGPVSGSSERFQKLHELASTGGLEDPQKYTEIRQYIDIAQFIDYVILNFYSGNEDWGLTNWYAGIQNPDGTAKYFAWDGELSWIDGAWLYSSPPGARIIMTEELLRALMKNPDFRMEFADRMYKHLYNDGALTDANSQARWIEINEPINLAIIGESARWGDVRYEPPITRNDWLRAYENVLTQMDGNVEKWVALTREAGYYPSIDPPMFNQHGGSVTMGFELTMAAPEGTIYYTTDGSDPRVPATGMVASAASVYQYPLVLTTTTHIKTRVLAGDVWSALHETTFSIREPDDSRLRITEIMYNPAGGDDYEFIELKNIGATEIDLSNMAFEGISFSFPSGTLLPAGEFSVLVRNPTAFAERYPNVPISGTYQAQLSNKGETIVLKDRRGDVLISIPYNDENGWPVSPDGRGDSLVFINLDGDPHHPENWRASARLYGSPGADDPVRSRYE
jgi:hypothetical protein